MGAGRRRRRGSSDGSLGRATRDRPALASGGGLLWTAARSLWRPPPPRPLPWLVAKRNDSRLGDTYGHWWLELDGAESYGWWPARRPVGPLGLVVGGRGAINGARRRRRTDPHHGDPAHHQFHPVLNVAKSDWQVRRDIRRYVRQFGGDWRWTLRRPSANCRSFQLALFEAVGLAEPSGAAASRGRGCPVLHPLRSIRCRLARAGSPFSGGGHRLGGPCGCPPLRVPPVPDRRRRRRIAARRRVGRRRGTRPASSPSAPRRRPLGQRCTRVVGLSILGRGGVRPRHSPIDSPSAPGGHFAQSARATRHRCRVRCIDRELGTRFRTALRRPGSTLVEPFCAPQSLALRLFGLPARPRPARYFEARTRTAPDGSSRALLEGGLLTMRATRWATRRHRPAQIVRPVSDAQSSNARCTAWPTPGSSCSGSRR